MLNSNFTSKTNKNGESCLHTACNYGHTQTVEYLTSIHTSLDLQDVVSLFHFIFFRFCFSLYKIMFEFI